MTFDWWTFGLQTVNVLILIWLLGHFFWRPVAAMIERRRKTAQDMLDDARAQTDAAAAALAEAEKRSAGFAQEREAVLQQARNEAAEVRRKLLDQAKADAVALRAETDAEISRDRAQAIGHYRTQAGRLAVAIAGKLAARLGGAAVRQAFLNWLLDQISALPAASRGAIANGGDVEIVSAAPLDVNEQTRIREAVGAALGGKIIFRTDPELIAGLELHTPHFVLSNSWRADLERILAELTNDERD